MDEIAALDAESAEVLSEYQGAVMKKGWEETDVGDDLQLECGTMATTDKATTGEIRWTDIPSDYG